MDTLMTRLANWGVDLILAREYFNNSIQDYIIAIAIFALFYVFLYLFRYILTKRLRNFVQNTSFDTDDFVFELVNKNIKRPLIIVLALNFSIRRLVIPELLLNIVNWVTVLVVAFYIVKAIQDIIRYVIGKQIRKLEREDRESETAVLKTLRKVSVAAVWVLVGLVVLQTMGIDVTALVAGVGVGGIAIAFALQNILEDLFASISLHFDKPFKVGDVILVGDQVGKVENIGTKTSRIKTLRGEQLSVPNKQLSQTSLNNFSRMDRRRVDIDFGIIYETPLEKVRKVKEIVQTIIEGMEEVEFNRIHFKELGEYSLNFELIFYVEDSSYEIYMDKRDEFNFKLMEEFEKEGIEFAYPTQAVVSHDDTHMDLKSKSV